jgi:chromosome segregation ATPase
MRLLVTIVFAMWLFNKHRKKNNVLEEEITITEKLQVKKLSSEWERQSNDLAFVQHAFNVEQTAYNNAVQHMSKQRAIVADTYGELNEMKAELSEYLKQNKINIVVFKRLSDECVLAYLNYEHEHQILMDMKYEFDASYREWNARLQSRLSKMRELTQSIKGLEHEIKDICADV